MNDTQYNNDANYSINKNHNIENIKEKYIKYNDVNNIKIENQNHINDMIFRDSIQSAISTPLPDAIPIDTDVKDVSSNISENSDNINIASEASSLTPTTASLVTDVCLTPGHLDIPNFIENTKRNDFPNKSITVQKSHFTKPSLPIKDSYQDHTDIFEELERIPDRMGFKISEVSFLTGVKSYVLRYWESEFEALRPKKATNNRRIYTQKDVTTILLIKKLLYKDKYSIEGAKKVLRTLQSEIKQQRKVFALFHQQQEAVKQLKELINTIFSLKKQYS